RYPQNGVGTRWGCEKHPGFYREESGYVQNLSGKWQEMDPLVHCTNIPEHRPVSEVGPITRIPRNVVSLPTETCKEAMGSWERFWNSVCPWPTCYPDGLKSCPVSTFQLCSQAQRHCHLTKNKTGWERSSLAHQPPLNLLISWEYL
ncbi:hypothetical protein LEMLEM_LOCUS2540, partial [Lemmus lemmus]